MYIYKGFSLHSGPISCQSGLKGSCLRLLLLLCSLAFWIKPGLPFNLPLERPGQFSTNLSTGHNLTRLAGPFYIRPSAAHRDSETGMVS